MKNIVLFTFIFSTFSFQLANAECKIDCVLKNRSQDQECELEKTPLTRCENFTTYMDEDKNLNEKYKTLLKRLNKNEVSTLKKSQRSWLDWRQDQCDEVDEKSNCDNGVCAGVAHDRCIIAITRQRTIELAKFGQDQKSAKENKFNFSKAYEIFGR